MAKSTTKTGISSSLPAVLPGVAKAALEGAGFSKGGTMHLVPIDKINVIDGFNVRLSVHPDYAAKIEAIAQDIATKGFNPTKPLAGFPGKMGDADVIYVTDGHGRLEAAKKANELRAAMTPPGDPILALPMILKAGDTSMRDLTIALVTENNGEKLNALEQAVVVKRLMKDKMEVAEVASTLHMTEKWVRELVRLINGPAEIREAVKLGKLSGTEALRIMAQKGVQLKDADGKAIKGKYDYSKAVEEVAKVLKRAEEKGGEKATRKDSDEGTKGGTVAAGVKMAAAIKIEFTAKKGSKHDFSEIASFAPLLGDAEWYKVTNAAGTKIELLEDISFKASILRPKKEDGTAPGTDAPAPKAQTKAEKKAAEQAAADAAEGQSDVSDL